MGSRPSQFTLTDPTKPLRLYSTTELLFLPPPTWLVEEIIPAGGLIGLYGAPGAGKSFVALDMALSVSTGDAWQGHRVEKGYVVYVSAEGGTGIGKRVLAWLVTHGIEPGEAKVAWLIESIPINTDSDQLTILLERIVDDIEVTPSLIVVDTLARCFDGDENQQEDMGRFVAGIDHLRHQLRTTVMVVHHTRLGGDRERGNTAFRGAADTMMALTCEGEDITLVCDKQKDAEEFKPLILKRTVVSGTESCVILAPKVAVDVEKQGRLSEMLSVLQEKGPLAADEWLKLVSITRPTFFRYLRQLSDTGKILKENGIWSIKSGI